MKQGYEYCDVCQKVTWHVKWKINGVVREIACCSCKSLMIQENAKKHNARFGGEVS